MGEWPSGTSSAATVIGASRKLYGAYGVRKHRVRRAQCRGGGGRCTSSASDRRVEALKRFREAANCLQPPKPIVRALPTALDTMFPTETIAGCITNTCFAFLPDPRKFQIGRAGQEGIGSWPLSRGPKMAAKPVEAAKGSKIMLEVCCKYACSGTSPRQGAS